MGKGWHISASQMSRIKLTFVTLCILTVMVMMIVQLKNKGKLEETSSNIPVNSDEEHISVEPNSGRMVSDVPRYLDEATMIKEGKQRDTRKCTSARHSSMMLLDPKPLYRVGDVIKVEINTFNYYGERQTVGGDFFRLWMENTRHKAAIAGDVFDNNNGSYTGVLRVQWSGMATIRCFLERRREEIAMFYSIIAEHGTLWQLKREFVLGLWVTESTQCSMTRNNLGDVCNFTFLNDGFPWYCEKPRSIFLNCDTYSMSWSLNVAYLPKEAQQRDIYYLSSKPDNDFLRSSVNITSVLETVNIKIHTPKTPCSQLSPEVTWQRKRPVGVIYRNTWKPTLCWDTLEDTAQAYRQCLKNRRLWIPGDSTSRQFKESLHDTLNLKSAPTSLHPQLLEDKQGNLSVAWFAHEFPLFHGMERYSPLDNRAQHILLESLPNNTVDIVVLYLYVHFNLVHPDIYRQHVQRLARAAESLLDRAPGVTIAVRGPFAYYRNPAQELVSYWGLIYADILHEEFSSMVHRVVYIDYWDMTVALGPNHIHPKAATVRTMIHYMMSLLCHRRRGDTAEPTD
ncbi:NXPE family member 4-like [Haliotis rufescens]|uniref:NXPE family member 4-like n=1 Tax=Haliotis rufescens TaxID=6454 RepID=UPI00201E831C|nr:NXPE family member 4-like [Haliotis rufescens]